MPVTYLILLAAGLGIIWLGLKTKDEVYRLTATVSGAFCLVWGFALTPLPLQLLIGSLIVVAVFPICLRCLNG